VAYPWDSGLAAEGVPIPGILTTGARGPVNPPFLETINVDDIEDRLTADGMDRLQATANWTNLNSYFARGGKILVYHGVSDPWFSALDTVDYYERMAKSSGGMDQVRANEQMYTRFRATEAYKELEAEVQRYEAWKRTQK